MVTTERGWGWCFSFPSAPLTCKRINERFPSEFTNNIYNNNNNNEVKRLCVCEIREYYLCKRFYTTSTHPSRTDFSAAPSFIALSFSFHFIFFILLFSSVDLFFSHFFFRTLFFFLSWNLTKNDVPEDVKFRESELFFYKFLYLFFLSLLKVPIRTYMSVRYVDIKRCIFFFERR